MRASGFAALTACFFWLWPAACPAAVDAGGSLALTGDDVYRGVSLTCGHPAVQAELHVRERGASYWAAFAGAWGSAGLAGHPCGRARELDLCAGYSLALGRNLSTTVTYTHYTFPGGGYRDRQLSGERYDYDQLGMSWSLWARLYLTLAWTPDALRNEPYEGSLRIEQDRGAFAYGAEWHQPLASWLSLIAGAGYDRMADPFGTGYGIWSLRLTHLAGPWEVDLGYFHTAYRAVQLFGPESAGGRVSATLLWRF